MDWQLAIQNCLKCKSWTETVKLKGEGIGIRFELSTEFTRWEQRLDARNAAFTGMKPEESHATHGLLVAANYRPTGMKPVVA